MNAELFVRTSIKVFQFFLSHFFVSLIFEWRCCLNVYFHLSWTWLHKLDWHSTKRQIYPPLFSECCAYRHNTPSVSILLFCVVCNTSYNFLMHTIYCCSFLLSIPLNRHCCYEVVSHIKSREKTELILLFNFLQNDCLCHGIRVRNTGSYVYTLKEVRFSNFVTVMLSILHICDIF